MMSSPKRVEVLRTLLRDAETCKTMLRDEEIEAIEDAVALYDDGDEGEVTT